MSQFVSLDGVELFVHDEGEGDVLLFVHGFPLDHTMWKHQLEEFSSTHRVVAPDLRGFGQSEDSAGAVSMERFADDLAGILDALEINRPVTLCGLSMGGYIAWQFWKRHPERLKKLIQCDTRALADQPEARETRLANAEKVLNEGPEFLAESMPQKMFSRQSYENQSEIVEATEKTILSTSPMGISAALRGMAERPDVTSWLGEIRIPSLLIVGEDDAITPADEMKTVAAAMPQATLVVIPEAGHMAPLEQPEKVNRVIRQFLGS